MLPWRPTGGKYTASRRRRMGKKKRRKMRERVWMVCQTDSRVRCHLTVRILPDLFLLEVELEEAWLTDAGLASLVTGLPLADEVPPPAEVLLSTLTHQQATTVRKRLDNYNETLKKRNRQPIRDVRDIFTEVGHKCTNAFCIAVAEHKMGKACWDCLRFHRDNNSELQVSLTCCMLREVFQSNLIFASISPSQGLSCAGDLSSRDLTQLSFISHIELTTFLMTLGIHNKRTRPPRYSGVFGVPLNTLLEKDRKKFPGVKVPVVFQKLLCILEQTGLLTEGILRVPASAAKVKCLRRELDRCYEGFDWSALRQVDASSLLKLFIRELPTPLLTHTHLSTYRIPSELHQVQALQLLTLLLPEANREILRALLDFLRKVVSHQDQNRMSLWNVSMVMAPNLFRRHHGNKRSIAKRDEMEEAVGGAQLIRLMIIHQDLLWTVPKFLLSQVRQMNQVSIQKQLGLSWTSRLLRKKNDKNERDQLCEGVIRVHAPLHTKISMVIQLEEQTTAKDITSRFECENSPVQHLYEVGGNICERRLHPDCVLLDVYRVNPHCDWLIKP
uniref:Rho-GAP domain-containing protein n=1 Tax=Oreochromis aureus TaxID=47969 RepID=A0A668T983_OREAU